MHGSLAYLVYNAIYWSIFKTNPPPMANFFVILFGIFPDFDGIPLAFKEKGLKEHDMSFQHHLNSWFHWPIRYVPLLVIFGIIALFGFYPQFVLIPVYGIYMHLLGDSISCGDGMMWYHGWRMEQFGRYINLWSAKTDGYHGNYWAARYRTTIFYKIELVLGSTVILLSIWYLILDWSILSWFFLFITFLIITYFIISIIITATRNLTKYEDEPKEGRYADYRKNPDYLKWMEKNGYEFNSKMHPVKKKLKN